MKKLLFTLLFSLSVVTSFAYNAIIDGIYYNLDTSEKTAEVTNKKGEPFADSYSGSVAIPEQVAKDGVSYSVTSIGQHAFSSCLSLTSVTIPNSVTSIGNHAFFGCFSLTSVTIPNLVTNIGKYAFYNCSSITSVNIPNTVKSISDYAFCQCRSLTSVTIPNSVTSIGDNAFYCCRNLTTMNIPNSVTSIGDNAFTECKGLTKVTIPNSVTSIGKYAFSGCDGLTSFVVESGNQYYCSEDNVLFNKNKTELLYCIISKNGDYIIPNSVTSIGNNAFAECTGLTKVTIPNSVTSIDEWAFYCCQGLTSISIPNSVTSIAKHTFQSCIGLTSVNIPNSVTSIGTNAFTDCDALVKVKVGWTEPIIVYSNPFPTQEQQIDLYVPAGTKEKYANENYWKEFTNIIEYEDAVVVDGIPYTPDSSTNTVEITNAESGQPTGDVVIPENVTINGNTYTVTSIGENAFSGCSDITSITIPKSVTSIGDYAFANCTSLVEVIVGWDEPLAIPNNVFENVPVNNVRRYKAKSSAITTLYVPKGTKEKYASAEVWKDFSVIQEYEPSSIGCINTDNNAKVFKHFVNGRLIIEKGGKQFTADGVEVK